MSEILTVFNEDNGAGPRSTSEIGSQGEALAADYLRAAGYRLVLANFKVPIGRNRNGAQITGEIDIIGIDGDTLCFVEVKTRRSDSFASPTANVDLRKQRQISRTARVYRRVFRIRDISYRYDVVSIVLRPDAAPKIELLKTFWTDGKFKKRQWKYDDPAY
ncbi:MAG: YraN family protein [Pyrinomonadaceae bacterium]